MPGGWGGRRVRRGRAPAPLHCRPDARPPPGLARRPGRPGQSQGGRAEGEGSGRGGPSGQRDRTPPTPPSLQLALLTQLTDAVLARAAAGDGSEAALKLNGALLEANPDCYTAWNARRAAVTAALAAGGDAGRVAAAGELAVTQKALTRNPKSYPAWHHRRWVVGHRLTALDDELALVDRCERERKGGAAAGGGSTRLPCDPSPPFHASLLDADDRNFHAWAYRRHVAALSGVTAAQAADAAAARVARDFSNFSAWHERAATLAAASADWTSCTLDELVAREGKRVAPPAPAASATTTSALLPAAALRDEFDLVRQATFTDPADQAPWVYHRWLLGRAVARYAADRSGPDPGAAADDLDAIFTTESDACAELAAGEPDRGAVRLALAARAALVEARAWLAADRVAAAAGAPVVPPPPPPAEAVEIYCELAALDPLRRGLHAAAAAGRAGVPCLWGVAPPREGEAGRAEA